MTALEWKEGDFDYVAHKRSYVAATAIGGGQRWGALGRQYLVNRFDTGEFRLDISLVAITCRSAKECQRLAEAIEKAILQFEVTK